MCIRDRYEIELHLLLREAVVDFGELLGTRVTLELERGAHHRAFHGIIAIAEDLGVRAIGEDASLGTVVRLRVVPELWILSQRVTSRVFHHSTALEIVR